MGGVEHRNRELATALARRGHRVTLAGWSSASAEPAPGVTVLPIGSPRSFYNARGTRRTSAAIRFAADVARMDPRPYDIVETANIPYLHLFPLALRCAMASKPLCVTWYEYWGAYWRGYVRGPTWRAYAGLERLTINLGSAAVAVSRLTESRVAARRRDHVHLIPIGIPVHEIRAAADGRPPGPPLVYAGRLLREKRVDLLLRAIGLLVRRGFNGPLLTVVGDGPDAARLRELAGELEISDSVVFRGHLPSSGAVWQEVGRASVAVQPSSREGYGLFPLEALAAGLPVVYCDSSESAVGEIVRDGIEGIRSEPSPDRLAEALGELMAPTASDRLAALSDAARARAEDYSWDGVASATEELYLELAETRASIDAAS
jgi:glycosyltransferase involved in cell wall biosynthesis